MNWNCRLFQTHYIHVCTLEQTHSRKILVFTREYSLALYRGRGRHCLNVFIGLFGTVIVKIKLHLRYLKLFDDASSLD